MMRRALRVFLSISFAATALPAPAANTAVIGGVDTSRWHGFNLLEKFTLDGNSPYLEEDFRLIAELGFTFVRLPIDYRCYTRKGAWLSFDESRLKEMDQAVSWGRKYSIHVCLNLHRAPGYCINPPREERDLWTDPAAQAAFTAHWKMFARRYQGIPSQALSFNLVNEPSGGQPDLMLALFTRTIAAIHEIDPGRLILVDGIDAGMTPQPGLAGLPLVVQSTRGYVPFGVSHYKAEWFDGADSFPVPEWPPSPQVPAFLYGPYKPDLQSTLTVRGSFPAGTRIEVEVGIVSARARLRILADGKPVLDRLFVPGPGAGEWEKAVYKSEWNIYQNIYNKTCGGTTTSAAAAITIENTEGDWIRMNSIRVVYPDGAKCTIGAEQVWGTRQEPVEIGPDRRMEAPAASDVTLRKFLDPWLQLAGQGSTVFVGEWGAYNKTPHKVTLAWMRDWLTIWREQKIGWALWNFRGSFGILDSGRADVFYGAFHRHQLDREMLSLLQGFLKE